MRFLVGLTLNESDRRLLIILLVVVLLLFLLLGLLGMAIRAITLRMSRRMDYEIHDAVIYRVIQTPEALSKYGRKKNQALFFKQSVPPFLIALFSFLFYLVYGGISRNWGQNFFGEFDALFYHFDWGNPDNFVKVFGMTLLAQWPPVSSEPSFEASRWASYVLVPLWLVSIGYYLVVCQAYFARAYLLNRRTHTVFEKSLEDFNFFDDVKATSVPPVQGTAPTPNPTASQPTPPNPEQK